MFVDLSPIFRSTFTFWGKFCVWCEEGSKLTFFVCRYIVVPAPFVEESICSTNDYFGNFAPNQLTITTRAYIWTFNFVLSIYKSILMPLPNCFDYCSFTVSFKIGDWKSFNFTLFFFFFKFFLPNLGSLHFYINFRIGFSISAGILKSFMLNQLREKCLLFLKPGLPSV